MRLSEHYGLGLHQSELDFVDVDMASGGDSGGPIFSSNGAWGMVAGSVGSNNIDQVIYVAINYVEAGLSVRVTFPGQ